MINMHEQAHEGQHIINQQSHEILELKHQLELSQLEIEESLGNHKLDMNPVNPEDLPEGLLEMIKDAVQNAGENLPDGVSLKIVDFSKGVKNPDELPFLDFSHKETYKRKVNSLLDESIKNQDFSKSAYLRDFKKEIDDWFEKRKKWFKSMVGKRIFLKHSECNCKNCQTVIKEGVLLENENQAMSFFGYENSYKMAGDLKEFRE